MCCLLDQVGDSLTLVKVYGSPLKSSCFLKLFKYQTVFYRQDIFIIVTVIQGELQK